MGRVWKLVCCKIGVMLCLLRVFQFPNIPVAEAIPRYLQKSKVDGRNYASV